MRKCIRCNTPMITKKTNKHGDDIKIKAYVYAEGNKGLTIGTADGFFKDTFSTHVNVAICPKCGEVSFYIDPDKL